MELAHRLGREVRLAVRSLRRAPAFTGIALVTLALGIGATTAIYGVLESVVLRPLPYRDVDRLVTILHPVTVPGTGEGTWGLSSGGYFQFRTLSRTLEDLGGYRTGRTVLGDDEDRPESVQTAEITASLFSVLGARPHLGRLISPTDDVPSASPTVVLSHELWQRSFGADPGVVGRTIRLADQAYEVIGVAEPGLSLPMPGPFASTADLAGFGVDVWVPLRLDPNGPFWNSHQYTGIGRLRAGATIAQAQAELAAITARLPELVPNAYSARFVEEVNFQVGVRSLTEAVLGPTVGRSLWILFGAVGLVLLIALANVANLFLVRLEARRREVAVRTALGGSRGQLVLQHLAESLVLTLGAGAVGLLLAWGGLPVILAMAPRSIPRLGAVSLHGTTVLFAVALAIVAGVGLGLLSRLQSSGNSGDNLGALRDGGRGLTGSRRQQRMRGALVIGQMVLAVVLLAAAGLLVRSFEQLRRVQPGLDPAGVLTFTVTLPRSQYATVETAAAFHEAFSARLAALPGVTAVGAASKLPLHDYGAGCTGVAPERRPTASGADGSRGRCVPVTTFTPGYFAAMGIPVEGRSPDWSDVERRTQAAVVTRALADRLWPGEDPIGRGVLPGDRGRDGYYRVVGVVPELRAAGLDQPPAEVLFVPATMLGPPPSQSSMLNTLVYSVRTTGDAPTAVLPAVRAVLREMDPQVPIVNPRAMTEVVARSVARTTFILLLLGIAATMALMLSAVGMYGVISYVVTQQRAEIGIRIALGAPVAQIGRMIVWRSLRLGLIGAALGVVAALWTTHLLEALLFGVSPSDPWVLASVPLMLLAVTIAAALAPALRAARTDPAEAMRT